MKTKHLNRMKPFSTEILSDLNLPLQSFHHLLYDSLMPWLPENSNPLLYRMILSDLTNDNPSFFRTLLAVYIKRKITTAPLLEKEWQLFSDIPLDKRARNIFKSLVPRRVSEPKIFFYYELIFYALLYSESLFVLLMEEATDTLRRYHVNQWLKMISDLRKRIHQLYRTRHPDDATILFFADTALKVLEIEIQQLYQSYCQPFLFLNSLNELKPRADVLEENETAINAMDDWFKNSYLPEFTSPDKSLKTTAPLSPTPTENDRLPEAFMKKQADSSPVQQPEGETALPATEKETGTDQEDVVIGSSEVRKILGIGKTKLLQLCKNDEIPHFRMGRNYKFEKRKILAYREQLKK